jgi:hypothetical protein
MPEPPGGQFVLHATALPGNLYDGHTLGAVIDATEKLTGCAVERGYVDKGYRGHNAANPRRMFAMAPPTIAIDARAPRRNFNIGPSMTPLSGPVPVFGRGPGFALPESTGIRRFVASGRERAHL